MHRQRSRGGIAEAHRQEPPALGLARVESCYGERFAVGGHSYGAFTTANLLAHTNLFAAGIARSGAYNRMLTPFGFQVEERTYREGRRDVRLDVAVPVRRQDKIDEPLLLIHGTADNHGAADNNPGTFPIQSDGLFAALQGLGGHVRYVSLPAEAHGYRARETALHVLWEELRWLDAHVKHAPRRTAARSCAGDIRRRDTLRPGARAWVHAAERGKTSSHTIRQPGWAAAQAVGTTIAATAAVAAPSHDGWKLVTRSSRGTLEEHADRA